MRNALKVMLGCLLMGIASPQARDWGFSKDTVYEWDVSYPPFRPSYDSVDLINEGDDPLHIDSVWVEVVAPENPESFFYAASWRPRTSPGFPSPYWGKTPIYDDRGYVKDSVTFVWPAGTKMGPGSMRLRDFEVDGGLKNKQVPPPSNRLVLRSVFRAKDRGADTLMVVGDYLFCYNSCPALEIGTSVKKKRAPITKPKKIQVNGRRLN